VHTRSFLLLLLCCLYISSTFAQTQKRPTVISPEVSSDRIATFRIYAPNVTEILVTGDWMARTDKPVPLSKRDDGVWVGTAGPLEPNVYFYTFHVKWSADVRSCGR
jgi:1,4-alpha-glucan branching enzyme